MAGRRFERRVVTLTREQRDALIEARDRHPKPYGRERAAAILKVAAGQSPSAVARSGLYRTRGIETVSDWIGRYEAGGIAGLFVRAGRGRKPACSPSARRRGGGPRRGAAGGGAGPAPLRPRA
jgi:hypothetical protein